MSEQGLLGKDRVVARLEDIDAEDNELSPVMVAGRDLQDAAEEVKRSDMTVGEGQPQFRLELGESNSGRAVVVALEGSEERSGLAIVVDRHLQTLESKDGVVIDCGPSVAAALVGVRVLVVGLRALGEGDLWLGGVGPFGADGRHRERG